MFQTILPWIDTRLGHVLQLSWLSECRPFQGFIQQWTHTKDAARIGDSVALSSARCETPPHHRVPSIRAATQDSGRFTTYLKIGTVLHVSGNRSQQSETQLRTLRSKPEGGREFTW